MTRTSEDSAAQVLPSDESLGRRVRARYPEHARPPCWGFVARSRATCAASTVASLAREPTSTAVVQRERVALHRVHASGVLTGTDPGHAHGPVATRVMGATLATNGAARFALLLEAVSGSPASWSRRSGPGTTPSCGEGGRGLFRPLWFQPVETSTPHGVFSCLRATA